MSGSGSRGSGGAMAHAVPIPAGSKKLVAELKAIVDFPEAEIYAMLRECNMDPNEAVHRLLSQDTFHEVKSKKDKKKETKEPSESRPRMVNSSSTCGIKAGTERVGRSVASQHTSVDYGLGRSKPLKKKEINDFGAVSTSSILGSNVVTNNPTQKSAIPDNLSSFGTTMQQPPSMPDDRSPSLQPSSGLKNNWLGKPGHVSMADIVKMGRPQAKPSSMPVWGNETSFMYQDAATTEILGAKKSPANLQSLENDNTYPKKFASPVLENNLEYDGCTTIDEPSTISGTIIIDKFEVHMDNEEPGNLKSSNLVVDAITSRENLHFQDVQSPEVDFDGKSTSTESRPASASDRQTQDGMLFNSTSSCLSPRQKFDHHEDESVASPATEFQHLSLHEEHTGKKSIEANPAVIIPDHLQVTDADCAHLSFGSFESGTFAGSILSKSLKTNVDVATVTDASSLIEHLDARIEHYNNEQLPASLTGNATSRNDSDAEPLEIPSASQPERTRNAKLDAQYNIPFVSGYTDSSTVQPNTGGYSYPHGNPQMQNLYPFSSFMQPNTLQSNLLTSSLPQLRDLDLSFSPLHTSQTLSTKYHTAVSSISGPTISLQEAAKPGFVGNLQQSPNLPGTSNSSTASAIPQHLPMHHYSQTAVPMNHYANMISYPFLQQSYTYLPSTFQQAYASNGPFNQSPVGLQNTGLKYLLPPYKTNASMTSLPQSATVPSVYGGFGNSAIATGNFSLNPAAAAAAAASSNPSIGFDEALNLHYKEESQYMPLQQTESPALWGHDASSRTMSALPGSTLYNYQAQSQQGALRQSQQPSQYGNLVYPNFYNSQSGAPREHEQDSSEGNLNGSQNSQAQPAHQLWQQSY